MPNYTTNKNLIKPTNGEYPDTWDQPVNTDWDIIDKALGSEVAVDVTSSDVTLDFEDAQNQRISATGSQGTSTRYISAPIGRGGMWVLNNRSNGTVRFTVVGSSTYLIIAAGKKALVFSDGTDASFADDVRLVQGTGITVSGDTISLASPVTTTLGGTGQTTYTNGQLLIGNASGGLTKAVLIGTGSTTITNGDGTITIDSTSGGTSSGISSLTLAGGLTGLLFTPNTLTVSGTMTLSGTLGAGYGGTGATSLTGYVYGNGSGVMTASATIPSTSITGLGNMSTQASTAVSITGGTISGVSISGATITGGTISNATTARVGTASALSTAETVSVLAPASTDGVVSRVTTATNFAFVSQNSSGTETFSVDGGGRIISGLTFFTGAQAKFSSAAEWAVEAYQTASGDVTSGAMAVRVDNELNSLVEFFRGSSSNIGSITASGSSVAYNTSSDYRLKENVVDLHNGVSTIKSLRPVNFTWKQNPAFGSVNGFIAHEVQALVPQAVNGKKDAVNPDGSMRIQGIDHSMLVPILTAAIKELVARVEALEAKV